MNQNKKNKNNMQLKDLREFVAMLPEEFNDYELVNGAYGFIEKNGDNNVYYRRDYSICVTTVDESTKEIVFLHQNNEEVNEIINPTSGSTEGV